MPSKYVRIIDIMLILTGVWLLLLGVFFLVEGVVVPLDPFFSGYTGLLATAVLKVLASGAIVVVWLLVWDRIARLYYSTATSHSRQ
jgi:hypothetical protein